MDVDTGEFKQLKEEHYRHIKDVPGYMSPLKFWSVLGLSLPVLCGSIFSLVVWAGDQRYEQKGETRYQVLQLKVTELKQKKSAGKIENWETSLLYEYERQLRNMDRENARH